MQYFVGAYAASPCVSSWDPELESDYYQQLQTLPNIKGLEHPFVGSLHPSDDEWFIQNIVDTHWQFLFTCVPGIMAAIGKNPQFGIASDDEHGRSEALSFMQKACEAIAKLNAATGRQAVQAIQVQTAPNRSQSSGSLASLVKSLETMLQWDWQGAQIVIEHCDTLIEGQTPAKGFLTLEDEISAIQQVNKHTETPIAMVMNWGRSVIETRSTAGAIQHIEKMKKADLLAGLMFSGVSDEETEYGQWQDTHMPPAPSETIKTGAMGSLMTEQEMVKCWQTCGNTQLPILGIKLGIRPKSMSVIDRIAHIRSCLAAMEQF